MIALRTILAAAAVVFTLPFQGASGADGNRLTHLDEPNNAWQFDRGSPKLVTPQWIGEEGVEAVVVLAIDDMSGDGQRFRNYLTPIIERLQQIDGRGPVSITCNRPEPDHPNMQWFLEQGVSLEAHTMTHPCPLLQRHDFRRARADYHRCVDLLAGIPNNRSIGFRFPCMDGQNTPSPRAYAELMNAVSSTGGFLSTSTSVGIVFTTADLELPRSVFGEGGADRFSRYLMTGFVNYIEDYPYPFVVGGKIWELPFVYPNDYTGQALHGHQSPITIADFKAAVDATVAKQGATSLCFHSGGWMRPEQMVDIVDHADRAHGGKIKFLNMREMYDRIVNHMLAGHPLRDAEGEDNGVRIFDINGDGYMDVLIANSSTKQCRIWKPEEGRWHDIPFPVALGPELRFGVIEGDTVAVAISPEATYGAWRFTGELWAEDKHLLAGVDFDALRGNVRLRDIDGDGNCELIDPSGIYRFTGERWQRLPFTLPEGVAPEKADGSDAGLRFADIDEDGREDLIFSDAERYGTWLFASMREGWSRTGISGERENDGVGEQHPRERDVLPPIVRADGSNNGAWIKRGHIYWQNEDTGVVMPHHIDGRSFGDLLGQQVNEARSPEASLRAMQPRPGFAVDLVAAEPLVMDPVDIAWDAQGRMWVCEMADYPLGIDNKGEPGARVAFLSDTDGDGTYDQRTLFADGLDYASTVLPWRDGVLIVAAPNIWFMRDSDGDGAADDKRVLYRGLGEGNEQHRSNGLAWGLDGWIYVANGDSGGRVESVQTGKSFQLAGLDFRIRPDTGELEPATGMTQHGRNRDDFGNWVAGNNSGAWQIALEDHDIRRNPRVDQPAARHGILGVIDLYPISKVLSHWSGYRAPPAGSPGKLTSGCGYTFYRDSLFDGLVEPSIYFSCPVHNCVHREVYTWSGVLMQTARAADESRSEFLRSSDSWFRPTAIRTGPDGAMYVADMYRLVIEHPEWIDDTLEKEMIADGRLRAGHDRGRIYRVFPEGKSLRKTALLAGKHPVELTHAIDSPNGWQRDTAHMMLTWLEAAEQREAIPELRDILRQSKNAAARAQALSALADLDGLAKGDVQRGLRDRHAGVRRNALCAGEGMIGRHDELGSLAAGLLFDADPHVQRQAAYALGSWEHRDAGTALGRFALANSDRPYLRAAALTSARAFADEVLLQLLAEEPTPASEALINALIDTLGEEGAFKQVPRVLRRLATKSEPTSPYEAWQFRATSRLLEAVGNHDQMTVLTAPLIGEAQKVFRRGDVDLETRLAALALAGRSADGEVIDALAALLDAATPVELQLAAARALLRLDHTQIEKRLLAGWPRHGAAVRNAILDAMLGRPETASRLLDAMRDNAELAASLDLPRRQFLLEHPEASIRERAARVLGASSRPDRAAVIARYTGALTASGDRDKGRELFASLCATCHRLDGIGNTIGPDLAALSNRSPQTYLIGILDPNRAIQANWMQFVAKTKDGRVLVGAIAEETSAAVTLIGIDGKRTNITRSGLRSLRSTGRSLMPEGLESTVDVGQMGDLLAYLRIAGEPRKTFPNNEPKLVDQADDQTVTLPAAAAEIYGPAIVFEQKYRNLGYWSDVRDRAEWTFQLARDGEYDIWVDWALHDDCTGGRLQIVVGDHRVAGAVPGTGTWDDYRWGRLGSLRLAAGRHRLIANAEDPLDARCLIDLRQLRLQPKGSPAPEGGEDWPESRAPASTD